MIDEIALTPDVFLGDNTFLSILPPEIVFSNYCNGKWENSVFAVITNLPSGEKRNRLQRLLTRWRKQNRIVYRLASIADVQLPNTDVKWAQEAIHSCYHFPIFHSIVMPCNTFEQLKNRSSLLHTVESYCDHYPVEHGESKKIRVERTVESYVEKLKPLLHYCTYLKLVDYCMNPLRSRYEDSLKAILECFFNNSNKVGCELHLSLQGYKLKDFTEEDSDSKKNVTFKVLKNYKYMKIFKESLKSIVPKGKEVEFILWDNKRDSHYKKLHDRFILTDIIGISAQNGFDIDENENPPAKVNWSVLNMGALTEHKNEFCKKSSLFNLLTSFTIKG